MSELSEEMKQELEAILRFLRDQYEAGKLDRFVVVTADGDGGHDVMFFRPNLDFVGVANILLDHHTNKMVESSMTNVRDVFEGRDGDGDSRG